MLAEEVEPEVNEEPFVAPPGLSVPADVELVSSSRNERSDLREKLRPEVLSGM